MMKNSRLIPKGWETLAGSTWPSKLLSLFNTLLLLGTSVQLGLHFWPSSAIVSGVRVDYLSPTLYALDLGVLLSLYISYFLKSWQALPAQAGDKLISLFSPLILLALSNLLFPALPLQALIWWARLLLYCLWALTLSPLLLKRAAPWLIVWLVFLLVLGVAQVYLGHSLQGVFYWLGERRLYLSQPALALQTIGDQSFLRAYSLFSHPNIFAGWSVLMITLLLSLRSWQADKLKSYTIILATLIVLLTASRAAALSLALIFLTNIKADKLISLCLVSCILAYLFSVRPESVVIPRLALFEHSLSLFSSSPLFGTGALGSLVTRPLQPDHFAPTLLLSWLGLVGMIQLYLISLKSSEAQKLKSCLPLLPLLIFDHYLVTSVPGLSVLILYLRFVIFAKPDKLIS